MRGAKLKILKEVLRTALASIPGSALNIAAAKRKMEQELRATGLARKATKKAVGEHFRRG